MTTMQLQIAGAEVPWQPGKAVCVGRNYADHARELNNPVPAEPILFIKPASAVVPFADTLTIPSAWGECHHELELAVLIGAPLQAADVAAVPAAIVGYGLALDLTLRGLQSELKAKGHPWERAKSFDGACPVSTAFIAAAALPDPQSLALALTVNGQLRQQGCTDAMLFPVLELIAHMSQSFTLEPGDIILTGTPAGVGPLAAGDQLEATLSDAEQHELLKVTATIERP